MTLRKSRVPFQGLSNRNINNSATLFGINSDPQSSNVQLKSPSSSENFNNLCKIQKNIQSISFKQHFKPQFKHKNHLTQKISQDKEIIQSLRLKRLHKNNKSQLNIQQVNQSCQLNENVEKVIHQLRQSFKTKGNIKKITKAWGFQNKGYISEERFKEILNNNLDIPITSSESHQIIKSFSFDHKNLDIKGFLNILFKGDSVLKSDIDVLNTNNNKSHQKQGDLEFNLSMIKRIKAINETTKYNDYEYEKIIDENTKSLLPKVKNQKSLSNRNSSYFDHSITHQLDKSMFSSINNVCKPQYKYQTTKSHAIQFTPTQYEGINQQKLRYELTPYDIPKNQNLHENKRENIVCSKEKVIQTLKQQRQLQKIRYQKKLQTMRENRKKEKQNIQKIDKIIEDRDKANMNKSRQETLAYNYVNFLRNDWR